VPMQIDGGDDDGAEWSGSGAAASIRPIPKGPCPGDHPVRVIAGLADGAIVFAARPIASRYTDRVRYAPAPCSFGLHRQRRGILRFRRPTIAGLVAGALLLGIDGALIRGEVRKLMVAHARIATARRRPRGERGSACVRRLVASNSAASTACP
jgi:hypothetical protein